MSPAISPTTLLRDRLDLLRRRLDFVRAALPPGTAVALDLVSKAKQVDMQLEAEQADNTRWHRFVELEEQCKVPFRDAFAFLKHHGHPVIASGGPPTLAEALSDELRAACELGITPVIVADMDDSFSDGGQMIRLRFPPADIWDLPVLAHEFGHFAAHQLAAKATNGRLERSQAVRRAIDDFLGAHKLVGAEREKWTDWLNEVFGDMFATYVLGPAFALSALPPPV